jgi:hypothetical protein
MLAEGIYDELENPAPPAEYQYDCTRCGRYRFPKELANKMPPDFGKRWLSLSAAIRRWSDSNEEGYLLITNCNWQQLADEERAKLPQVRS